MPYFWLTPPPVSLWLEEFATHQKVLPRTNSACFSHQPTSAKFVFFLWFIICFFSLSCFAWFLAFLSSQPPVDKNNWLFFSSCLVWLLFCSHYTSHLPQYLLGFFAKCSQVNLKWLWPHKSNGFPHPKVIRSYNNVMHCQYFRFKNYCNSSFSSTVMAIIMSNGGKMRMNKRWSRKIEQDVLDCAFCFGENIATQSTPFMHYKYIYMVKSFKNRKQKQTLEASNIVW